MQIVDNLQESPNPIFSKKKKKKKKENNKKKKTKNNKKSNYRLLKFYPA